MATVQDALRADPCLVELYMQLDKEQVLQPQDKLNRLNQVVFLVSTAAFSAFSLYALYRLVPMYPKTAIALGITAGGGSYSPGTLSINISAAKIDKIKTS